MKPLADYPLSELKLVYRVLHGSLMQHLELMDADFLGDLQSYLRARAADDGVDTSDHGARRPSCLLYTSPSPRDATLSRMPSSA